MFDSDRIDDAGTDVDEILLILVVLGGREPVEETLRTSGAGLAFREMLRQLPENHRVSAGTRRPAPVPTSLAPTPTSFASTNASHPRNKLPWEYVSS